MPKQIPLKQWKVEEAERLGIKFKTLESRIQRGEIVLPPLNRINTRVINVIVQ